MSHIDRLPEVFQGEAKMLPADVFAVLGQSPQPEDKFMFYVGYRLSNGDIIYINPAKARGWVVTNLE